MTSKLTGEKANQQTGESRPWMDWEQVRLNGGPPCFHLDPEHEGNRFCGRAQRWFGHIEGACAYPDHNFISLDDYLAELREAETPRKPSVDTNWSVKELIDTAEKLLEWMPIYSKGSSGHIRQTNLRTAIDKFKVPSKCEHRMQYANASGKWCRTCGEVTERNPHDFPQAELREVSQHPEPAPGDWDIIAEIAKLVERQREIGCAEESCGCPGSQLAGLLDKLRAEFQGECAKEKPWPEGALVNANRIVEPEHPTPAPQESRLRSSAYESSSECPICELPCKHCGRTKINHFGRAWHCKRYVIDDESDPIFEVEGEHPGGPPAKEKHP